MDSVNEWTVNGELYGNTQTLWRRLFNDSKVNIFLQFTCCRQYANFSVLL